MSRGDDQGAIADHVTDSTVDLGFVLKEVGNLTVFLRITGVPEQDHALDLAFDVVGQLGDRVVHDGSTLAV